MWFMTHILVNNLENARVLEYPWVVLMYFGQSVILDLICDMWHEYLVTRVLKLTDKDADTHEFYPWDPLLVEGLTQYREFGNTSRVAPSPESNSQCTQIHCKSGQDHYNSFRFLVLCWILGVPPDSVRPYQILPELKFSDFGLIFRNSVRFQEFLQIPSEPIRIRKRLLDSASGIQNSFRFCQTLIELSQILSDFDKILSDPASQNSGNSVRCWNSVRFEEFWRVSGINSDSRNFVRFQEFLQIHSGPLRFSHTPNSGNSVRLLAFCQIWGYPPGSWSPNSRNSIWSWEFWWFSGIHLDFRNSFRFLLSLSDSASTQQNSFRFC